MKKKVQDLKEPEIRMLLNAIGIAVETAAEHLGVERPLFCLLLTNDPKFDHYLSNISKQSAVNSFCGILKRLVPNLNDN